MTYNYFLRLLLIRKIIMFKSKYVVLLVGFVLVGCGKQNSEKNNVEVPAETMQAAITVSKETVSNWIDTQVLVPEKMSMAKDNPNFLFNAVDLNNDGQLETLVMMQAQYFCGSGGCSAFLFDDKGQIINRFTVFNEPVFLSDALSNGWKNIVVRSGDNLHTLAFDGKQYPSNPSVAPVFDRKTDEEKAKALVMKNELYEQDGHELSPYFVSELLMPLDVFYFSFKHHGEPDKLFIAKVNTSTGSIEIEKK